MFYKFRIFFFFCLFLHQLSQSNSFGSDDISDDSYCTKKYATISHGSKPNYFERTLVLLKPDSVKRKIVGKIIERFENKGFKLVGMKLFLASRHMAEQHYIEHKDESFFDNLMDYMTSNPLIPMIWEGPNAVKAVRNMLGPHDPLIAVPGTIRGDFSVDIKNNVIHGSDTIEAAIREIKIWFLDNEIRSLEMDTCEDID